jgi:hypothetical protein
MKTQQLAPKKCSFFKRKVKFVGHIVSAAGVEIDPDKTEFFICVPKNYNIIYEDAANSQVVICQTILHQPWVCCWTVGHPMASMIYFLIK